MELQEKMLKRMMKNAIKEALHGERKLMYDVMAEVVEDIALARAIDEGKSTKNVGREDIFKILRTK